MHPFQTLLDEHQWNQCEGITNPAKEQDDARFCLKVYFIVELRDIGANKQSD